MDLTTYADILLSAQRTMLLTVCKENRTGIMPIDITARMRYELYRMEQRGIGNRSGNKNSMLGMWQRRWNVQILENHCLC